MTASQALESRPPLWLMVFVLTAAVSTASVFYFLKEKEKNEKLSVSLQLTEAVSSQKKLEESLQTLRISGASLEEKVQSQEEIILTIKHSLDEQQALRQKAESEITIKESEIRELRAQVLRAEEEKRDLQSRLEKQYEDYYNMKTQLSTILKTKEELEAKAKELAENGPVSLGTVVIRQNG